MVKHYVSPFRIKFCFFLLSPLFGSLYAQIPNAPGGVGSVTSASSIKLWLDAFDPDNDGNSFNNPANGAILTGNVWKDKSGNAYNLSNAGVASTKPTYNTAGTYTAVNFNSSNSQFLSNGVANNLNPGTVFFVSNSQQGGQPGVASNSFFDDGTISLRFEEFNKTGFIGYTHYSVADVTSTVATPYSPAAYSIVSWLKASAASTNLAVRANAALSNIATTANADYLPLSRIGAAAAADQPNFNAVEIIAHNVAVNGAQRKIIENYLSSKYGLIAIPTDLFFMDTPANGNYFHDVAGIGQESAASKHTDAQGTSIVRINTPSALVNGGFLLWGNDGTSLATNNTVDIPAPVTSRLATIWRPSVTGGGVGTVSISFDMTGLGVIASPANLRLLLDKNNNGIFSDETVGGGGIISGATQAGNIYTFAGVNLTDATRFTIGTTDAANPLPIDLLSFTAVPDVGKVNLKWETTTETNNKYFTIERSGDAQNFTEVTKVNSLAPNGNSILPLNYLTTDVKPLPGTSYYRLKQTDYNGQFRYFTIVSVDFVPDKNITFSIYPNPNTGEFTVDFSGIENNHEVQITMHNELGSEVYSESVYSNSIDSNKVQIAPSVKLAKGKYFCSLVFEGIKHTLVVIIN